MTTRERDAWTFAYRLYDEYAPKLRRSVLPIEKKGFLSWIFYYN